MIGEADQRPPPDEPDADGWDSQRQARAGDDMSEPDEMGSEFRSYLEDPE